MRWHFSEQRWEWSDGRYAQFTPPARQTRQDGPVCVVSGGANWVGPTSAFCVGVRPAVALRRPTHPDTDQTQNAPVWRSSQLNSHLHIRHDKTVLSVSCLARRCELAFKVKNNNTCIWKKTTWQSWKRTKNNQNLFKSITTAYNKRVIMWCES